jgi:hypothetical protein
MWEARHLAVNNRDECRHVAGWRNQDASGTSFTRKEKEGMAKKTDISALNSVVGTLYPPPFDAPCRARERKRLGDAAGSRSTV